MKRLSVEMAKQMTKSMRAEGAIIILIDSGRVQGASYGSNSQRCRVLGRTMDKMCSENLETEEFENLWENR